MNQQNAEEAGRDKREKSEDDGPEEEENGWWAERVVGALGGLGGDYGDTWYRSHAHLLHGDGPLPHTWRLYIAALVGASCLCLHPPAYSGILLYNTFYIVFFIVMLSIIMTAIMIFFF